MLDLRAQSLGPELHERHARDPMFVEGLSHRMWITNSGADEMERGAFSVDPRSAAEAEEEFQRSMLSPQVAETAMGTILDDQPEDNLAYLEQLAADEAKRTLAISVGQGLAADEDAAARMDGIIEARQKLQTVHNSAQLAQTGPGRQN